MLRIAVAADIMISTTHGSLERFTKLFNKEIAKVTVIDEAGCVLHAEAMIPWRNSRLLLLGEDINQLPPAVISKNKRISVGDKEIYANIFGTHGLISFLHMIMTSGRPCLQLGEQLRICNGGFDLACDIVYKDYQVSLATATVVHSPNYKYAFCWNSGARNN